MGVFAFMVIGLVLGLLAQLVIPRNQKLGVVGTCVLGMLGAMVGGGVLGSLLDPNAQPFELKPLDLFLGVAVACVFLVVVGLANSRRAHV